MYVLFTIDRLKMKTIFITLIVTFTTTLVDFNVTANLVKDIGESLQSDIQYGNIFGNSLKELAGELGTDVYNQALQFGPLDNALLPEIVQYYRYPLESYYVTTEDGYILNIFRIPHGKTRKRTGKVVLIQHGLFLAATDYILFGPQQGLAYYLADYGYDVWLMNCRGNIYSRNHTTYDPETDSEFWLYSWHEIGIYDTASTIDFVLDKTGNKTIYHIGHSQGTTCFYVLMSIRPDYNKKIEHHISLAPTAFMKHLFSPIMRLMAPFASVTPEEAVLLFGAHEFLPTQGLLKDIGSYFCTEGEGRVLCKNFLLSVAGYSPSQMNASSIPLIAGHYPAGATVQQVLHYCQEYNSGKFAQYDHGLVKNLITYLRPTPPDYDLSEITAPITLMYSANDWLCSKLDVEKFASKLPNLKEKYLIPISTWNHLDFVFGKDAPSVVYPKIFEILEA